MLYIDAFNHILPKKYQAVLEQKVPNRDMSSNLSRYAETVPTLLDLDARFRLMDSVEGYMQVLTLAAPTVESVASPDGRIVVTVGDTARVAQPSSHPFCCSNDSTIRWLVSEREGLLINKAF